MEDDKPEEIKIETGSTASGERDPSLAGDISIDGAVNDTDSVSQGDVSLSDLPPLDKVIPNVFVILFHFVM